MMTKQTHLDRSEFWGATMPISYPDCLRIGSSPIQVLLFFVLRETNKIFGGMAVPGKSQAAA